MNLIGVVLLSLITHFIFSKIGLMFSIPFGFASSIWPAAGVTLGLYLIYGRGVLLGSFIGYILAVTSSASGINVQSIDALVLPALLGAAAVAQLVVTKFVLQRFVPLPVESAKLANIIKFLLIIGPLCCLTASLIGASVLSVVGQQSFQESVFTWAIWWVGDFTGVVFFTPLVLFLKSNRFIETPAQPLKIVGSNLVVFAFISMLFAFSSTKYKNQNEQQFEQKASVLIKQFENAQNTIESQLLALSGLFQANNNIGREDFRSFTKKVNDKSIKLRALAWIPKVTDLQRALFSEQVRNEGFDNFDIKYLAANGFKVSPQADYYLPILFSEPLASNRAAIGLDLNTHPSVKQPVHDAIQYNDFIVTPILPLVQQQDKFTGVIVYYPVFSRDSDNIGTTSNLLGMVEAVFELDILLQNLPASQQTLFAFKFTYGQGNVYQSQGYSDRALLTHEVVVDVFDKTGTLRFSSLPNFEKQLVDWASWFVVIGGTLVGVISIIFLYSLTSFSANLALQVEKKTSDLKITNEKLEIANKAKTMFLANMSHEYRTPLNAIIGFTEIAKRQVAEKEALEYFEKIESSSKIMLGIVNDVLDISKIQANEFELESAPFELTKAILEVDDMLRYAAEAKGLVLNVQVSEIEDVWVKGDKTRFKQIVINLLNNAIKFTEKGQVTLTAKILTKNADSLQIGLEFEDTGIGIDKTKQSQIFKPFEQEDEKNNRRFGGTGLGLSIVTELCLLMHGEIKVDSRVGVGTKFSLRMMFNKVQPPEKEVTDNPVVTNQLDFRQLHILIVEDNKINQEVARKQVESLGAKATVCDDGQACLDFLAHSMPDLILMDLQMPVLDGFMTSKAIQADPNLSHLPIIILSASVTTEDKAKATELGITNYLTKPFIQKDLVNVIQAIL